MIRFLNSEPLYAEKTPPLLLKIRLQSEWYPLLEETLSAENDPLACEVMTLLLMSSEEDTQVHHQEILTALLDLADLRDLQMKAIPWAKKDA